MNNINENIDKNIDENIINKLNELYYSKNIPNIIFHGENLTFKKTYIEYFLQLIYKTNENINKYCLTINCSHGKGNIKFIRDNIKHFANTIIINDNNYLCLFKSIVLLNADNLTTDAQSALRRCIEIYNKSTRFFIVVENKYKLLKPILSRFSDIYCTKKIDLKDNSIENKKFKMLIKILNNKIKEFEENKNNLFILNTCHYLYNNSFSGLMLIKYINKYLTNNLNKYRFLVTIDAYKKELHDEKIIILFCLNYIFLRKVIDLENISNI
tara:strand:- start:748 stop:1554 length:807 start_codon:yes stop_codon:yes gene_type:complete